MNLSFASESFYWRYSTKEHFSRGTSPESLGEPKSCENSLYLVFPQTFSFSQTFTRVSITINIIKLQSPIKFLARLSTFAAPVWEIYQFTPSPRFNVVYRDEFVIAPFQHCLGGRGAPIPVMPLLIVSKIACQRIFMHFHLFQACQGLLCGL